jgi:hypothetical protein
VEVVFLFYNCVWKFSRSLTNRYCFAKLFYIWDLKGQCQAFFAFSFFPWIRFPVSHGSLIISLAQFRIFPNIPVWLTDPSEKNQCELLTKSIKTKYENLIGNFSHLEMTLMCQTRARVSYSMKKTQSPFFECSRKRPLDLYILSMYKLKSLRLTAVCKVEVTCITST